MARSSEKTAGKPGRRSIRTGKPIVRKGYPASASQYADPEDRAYPLDTPAHVRNAASRFAQNKSRYSPAKRAEISRRIAAAEKRHGIGKSAKKSKK